MRSRFVAVLVGAVAAMAVVGGFTPADGGEIDPEESSTLLIDKVVAGPVPEGTVFEIQLTCKTSGGTTLPVPPYEYDANGDGPESFRYEGTMTCTVEETVTGGAAVSYACEAPVDPPVPDAAAPEVVDVECTTQQTVVFNTLGNAARITVTNTFEPEPEPEPDAAPDTAARQPGVVAARPTFTG